MKEQKGKLEHNGVIYPMAFNFNVMEEIQEEYGTMAKWGALTDGSEGEPNAKAVKFGITAMINEGIDIENEGNGNNRPHLTLKQAGRILFEIGLSKVATTMNSVVIASTESEETSKNE